MRRTNSVNALRGSRGDLVVDVGGSRPLAVLARLALAAGREVSSDSLISAVSGMMLCAEPAWIAPMVTTTGSIGDTRREAIV